MKDLKITVTSAFGIEGLLRREMNRLGYQDGLAVGKGAGREYGRHAGLPGFKRRGGI